LSKIRLLYFLYRKSERRECSNRLYIKFVATSVLEKVRQEFYTSDRHVATSDIRASSPQSAPSFVQCLVFVLRALPA